MISLLSWILGNEERDFNKEFYLSFGIITFILINLLITIYSHEFSEDLGTRNNPELWIERRCRASGVSVE